MKSLQSYHGIVDDEIIHKLYKTGKRLYSKHMLHINSTSQGGGVAEMLNAYVPLMNDIGIDAGWRILHGNPDFFGITKKFHNSLQGDSINLTEMKKGIYTETSEIFSSFTHIGHDFVVIHDPQPLPLINFYRKRQPWVWRCHIDLSHPNRTLWAFLKQFILKYDIVIVSHENYKQDDLPVEQRIIHPAIDPLTSKNKDLTDREIKSTLKKFGVPMDKPLITQISRFDKWKDPEGVLEIFKIVKQKIDCRLVLCGNMASDDPEGIEIFEDIQHKAADMIESGDVILITAENNFLVNALQRASAVIIQKSLREGFGLTVTESLWKGTPVVASNIGGIPLQIKDEENGYTVTPTDIGGFAERIIYLLENESKAKEIGARGKEHVRKHFLMTRLILDYMNLMNDLV
ncbi:MAG: glycosyltransferase [Bacteroidota bacterium]